MAVACGGTVICLAGHEAGGASGCGWNRKDDEDGVIMFVHQCALQVRAAVPYSSKK